MSSATGDAAHAITCCRCSPTTSSTSPRSELAPGAVDRAGAAAALAVVGAGRLVAGADLDHRSAGASAAGARRGCRTGCPSTRAPATSQSADGKALMLFVRPRAPTSDYRADRRLIDDAERAGAAARRARHRTTAASTAARSLRSASPAPAPSGCTTRTGCTATCSCRRCCRASRCWCCSASSSARCARCRSSRCRSPSAWCGRRRRPAALRAHQRRVAGLRHHPRVDRHRRADSALQPLARGARRQAAARGARDDRARAWPARR